MSGQKILIYLLRRDLRLADNPVFHELSKLWSKSNAPFTAVLPIYVFPAQQVEVSGFLKQGEKSPYPEARSQVGKYWRCGHHRATFLAESVWDLKKDLEQMGSGLEIRAGLLSDVVKQVLDSYKDDDVTALWMTDEEGVEEKREEKAVRKEVEGRGKEFKLWKDEKYFIDDDDLPYKSAKDLPDVFSTYRKQVEPLREAPRRALSRPSKLPPLPSALPVQTGPFMIPASLEDTISALHKPLSLTLDLSNPPKQPGASAATTAHPFKGGATTGQQRISHLLKSGAMASYKDTRNGLLGADFSSKLSAWLALGCVSARQIHHAMLGFEDGTDDTYKGSPGYGKGENKGTAAMRFELLWRDYFRLCTRKFGPRLFREGGFRGAKEINWSYDKGTLDRWLEGTTGMGLVDAAQRELYLTGYTSNRTRQNVASFLSKHLALDWRLGAEWYESCLVDYDLSSNWGNWQYNSGVGNDPREGGMGRKFNPVKQGHDYDPKAEYVKTWVEEVKDAERPGLAFQYKPKEGEPLVRIDFKERAGGGGPPKQSGGGRFPGGGRGGRGGRGRGRGGGGKGREGRQGLTIRDDA